MRLSTFLPLALLATTAFAACTLDDSLSALESCLASAEREAAKAGRLLERAKSYGTSSDIQHKIQVFTKRQKHWQAEVAELEALIEQRMADDDNACPATASSSAASPTAELAAITTSVGFVRQPYASLESSRILSSSSSIQTTTTTMQTTMQTTVPTTSPPMTAIAATTSHTTTVAASTSIPAASPSSGSSGTSSGASSKKGVGYNDVNLTKNLAISWAYNWGQKPDGMLDAGVEFVPMLWDDNAGDWMTNAQNAIESGSSHLLGFNEPDLPGQADMPVSEAVAAWKKYMSPFYGRAKLVSPAVTNGGYPLGRDYLASFFDSCPECLAETEAIALHWYDGAFNVDYFKNYLTEAYERFKKPIWVTEFAGSGSVAEQQKFFQAVLPWMEGQPWIERYAGFGDFVGTYVNADSSLTTLGRAYSDTS
ncbi:hypothetical protein JCM3770_005326 [Rhodotorula araucariae]